MKPLEQKLYNYGRLLLATQLNQPIDTVRGDALDESSIRHSDEILSKRLAEEHTSQERLTSIFTFVSPPEGMEAPASHTLPLKALSLDLNEKGDIPPAQLWTKFQEECGRLKAGAGMFETFFALFRKYAWYVPSRYEAISVYEQFKAIVALAHCIEQDGNSGWRLLLVGGDVPGIQRFLQTVTAKGALKGYKGRSFYIQLLTDLVARVIIDRLSLPTANIIYNAGGNFKLIAPLSAESILNDLRREINEKLLRLHNGELFAAIAWLPIEQEALFQADKFGEALNELTGERIRAQKEAWFAELCTGESSKNAYQQLFAPSGRGGPVEERCDVCHVDITESHSSDPEVPKCAQCVSFERLGERSRRPYLIVQQVEAQEIKLERGVDKPRWNEITQAFGYHYRFLLHFPRIQSGVVYHINNTDFLPESPNGDVVYNFRFVGNITPTLTTEEVACLKKYDESIIAKADDVKDTTCMARFNATGIKRFGVLRMDVDSLGTIFRSRLCDGNMLRTSALSSMLSVFFEGWLNRICEKVVPSWTQQLSELKLLEDNQTMAKSKLPYIIYSGGDDLFIVAPWDVLPLLAERIRYDLGSYVTRGYVCPEGAQNHSPITISAGIGLFYEKFPIYQAGEIVKEALESAKSRKSNSAEEKNAINFLGMTVGWGERQFGAVKELAFRLAELIEVGREIEAGKENETASHGLLQFLNSIAYLYLEDCERAEKRNQQPNGLIYGSWMWNLTYGLFRLRERVKSDKLKAEIMRIGGDTLDLTRSCDAGKWEMISYLNLPVRWAEYLIREGGQDGEGR
ncbi:MAG: type III-A CRISPR-associated protein Cas10/Csm1 [Deltaproteobacteria bacterium]|nr:type III-A CRISPR-associated protein Cas10/Csm1 [Deltaproteobacteria bacterium]